MASCLQANKHRYQISNTHLEMKVTFIRDLKTEQEHKATVRIISNGENASDDEEVYYLHYKYPMSTDSVKLSMKKKFIIQWFKKHKQIVFNDGSKYVPKYQDLFEYNKSHYHFEEGANHFEEGGFWSKSDVEYRSFKIMSFCIEQMGHHLIKNKLLLLNNGGYYYNQFLKSKEPQECDLDKFLTNIGVPSRKIRERNGDPKSKKLLSYIFICMSIMMSARIIFLFVCSYTENIITSIIINKIIE